MSSYVVSDNTTHAIVQGLVKTDAIFKRDRIIMTEAIRKINEKATAARYRESPRHRQITSKPRDYTDQEIYMSCDCWLYQIEEQWTPTIDELTIIAAVKLMKQEIYDLHEAAGDWYKQRLARTGYLKVFIRDDYGTGRSIDRGSDGELIWDLED